MHVQCRQSQSAAETSRQPQKTGQTPNKARRHISAYELTGINTQDMVCNTLNDTRFMVDVTRDESGLSWDTFLSRMRSQHLCLTPDAHARIHVDYAAGIHELICYQI